MSLVRHSLHCVEQELWAKVCTVAGGWGYWWRFPFVWLCAPTIAHHNTVLRSQKTTFYMRRR